MIDAIRTLYRTVKTAMLGDPVESATVPETPVAPTIVSPEHIAATEPATVSDEWTVRTYVDPVFVKVGRAYMDAGALILRSDRDARGFVIPEDELDEALTGGIGAVLLLDQTATVGIARLLQAGGWQC